MPQIHKAQNQILPIPISEISDDYWIYIHCDDVRCIHGASFRPSDLVNRLGGDVTLRSVLGKARCTKCGRHPVSIKQIFRRQSGW